MIDWPRLGRMYMMRIWIWIRVAHSTNVHANLKAARRVHGAPRGELPSPGERDLACATVRIAMLYLLI